MSRLILHIGTHKTGTTTIQDTLWHNAAKLARHGVEYPKLPYPHCGHHGLIAESVGLSDTYRLKKGGFAHLKKLAEKFADSDRDLILSSEEFSRAERNRSVDFDRLREIFKAFERVTVLCFIRPQWQFLQSIYVEISRNRSPPRPPDLVREALETGQCQGLYMNYSTLLSRLERSFDPSEIILVDFETARQTRGGILDAVLRQTKSNLTFADLKPVGGGHLNASVSAVPQWMANLLAEPCPSTRSIRSAAETVVPQNKPTCCLTRQEISDLSNAFENTNRDLIARRLQFQPDFSMTCSMPPDDCFFREDVTVEHWLSVGQILARRTMEMKEA